MSMCFTQCCPTCGRRIQIQTKLLGRTVACQHCRAEFVTHIHADREQISFDSTSILQASDPLMARADALLDQSGPDATVRS